MPHDLTRVRSRKVERDSKLLISQIFLSDLPEDLSAYLRNCVEQIKALHPSHQHCIYNNATLRDFIAGNFGDRASPCPLSAAGLSRSRETTNASDRSRSAARRLEG